MASLDKDGKIFVYLPEDLEYERKQAEINPEHAAITTSVTGDEPLWNLIKDNIIKLEAFKKKHWENYSNEEEFNITKFFKKSKKKSIKKD